MAELRWNPITANIGTPGQSLSIASQGFKGLGAAAKGITDKLRADEADELARQKLALQEKVAGSNIDLNKQKLALQKTAEERNKRLTDQQISASKTSQSKTQQDILEAQIEAAQKGIPVSEVLRTKQEGFNPAVTSQKTAFTPAEQQELDNLKKATDANLVAKLKGTAESDGKYLTFGEDGKKIIDTSKAPDQSAAGIKDYINKVRMVDFLKSDEGKKFAGDKEKTFLSHPISTTLEGLQAIGPYAGKALGEYLAQDESNLGKAERALKSVSPLTQKELDEGKTPKALAFKEYSKKFDVNRESYNKIQSKLKDDSKKAYEAKYKALTTTTSEATPKMVRKDAAEVEKGINAHYTKMLKKSDGTPVGKVMQAAINRAQNAELTKFRDNLTAANLAAAKAQAKQADTLLKGRVDVSKTKLKAALDEEAAKKQRKFDAVQKEKERKNKQLVAKLKS